MTSDVVRWTKHDKNTRNDRISDSYNQIKSHKTTPARTVVPRAKIKPICGDKHSEKSSCTGCHSLDETQHPCCSTQCNHCTNLTLNRRYKLSVKNFLVIKSMSNVRVISNDGLRSRIRTFCKSLSCLFVIFNLILSNFIVMVCASDNTISSSIDGNISRTSRLLGDPTDHDPRGYFTDLWAVHIPNGDENGLADMVAAEHGFSNKGKIFGDHYHFHHNSVAKRSIEPSHHHQHRLNNDGRVVWSKQQRAKSRQKRDYIRMRPTRTSSQTMTLAGTIKLDDPKWPQMWYLNRGNDLDMNVIPVWKEGITGKGVVVTILDDGLEADHPDLEHNYDALASYDVNSHDEDPMPRYDLQDTNRHGTRCAGEVAATANNSICTVGIAYGAKVGGVRMLDGDVTDSVEARSLSLNPQHIDIYSASWGPDDDGKTVDGPGELATHAFIDGVTKGRGGKGSIFIWASGNGGRETDNCNCDGYTNSIWTLSISSATEEGHVPWYSEKCSSTLATTYSSGGQGEKQVVTTDLHHGCTPSHTGTSASAPLAAGIVALVLEANRNLTWRDLQHIVVRTAKPGNLKDPTWSRNGVGRRVSHSFGYGLMDAAAMVKVAKTWKTVPEQQRCEINAPHSDKPIPPKNYITLQLNVQHCMGVNFLEHVQAKITLTSPRRGDIQIYLKSPAGTKVTLLTTRNHDISRSGFNQWPFMSVHTWGESPHGSWQLEIHNEGRYLAQLNQWDMIFYGTSQPPQPNDPVRVNPGKYGSYGGEMEHNILDFDSDTASGQWRNMQQVGEAHVDIQRTTSNDLTSKACLSFSTDQKCLECEQTTFFYDGGCYIKCPNGSYMVPEGPNTSPPYRSEPGTGSFTLRQDREENFAEVGSYEDLDDILPRQRDIMRPLPQKFCASCHPTCLRCRGSAQSECISCPRGFKLRVINSDESYCYPLLEGRPTKNNLSRELGPNNDNAYDEGFLKDLNTFYMIVMPSIIVIILIVVINAYKQQIKSTLLCKPAEYDYNRIEFNAESEEKQSLRENEVRDQYEIDDQEVPQVHQIPAKIYAAQETLKSDIDE